LSNGRTFICISPDLTSKECEHNKRLREELKSRKNSGEKNLYVKHGKIVTRQAGDNNPGYTSN